MQLGPDSIKNISDLFTGKNQYRIPRYQRRYVWDKPNWEALWRDLIQLQRQINDGDSAKKHFTGTIITHAEKDGAQESWDIIDGQQRLTTFQVIFCVIHDLCASGAYRLSVPNDFLTTVKQFTKLSTLEMGRVDVEKGDFCQYRLIPAAHDREAFLSMISGDLGKGIREQSDTRVILNQFDVLIQQSDQNRIITAYGYFGTKIMDYLIEKGADKLQNLTSILLNNFRIIKVELNDVEDEPEKIFETINDTGRMLDDFDYLRNHLFLRARKLAKPTLDDLHSQYWEKFEEWTAEKLDVFFRTFLMTKLGPECFNSTGRAIKPFDKYREYSNTLMVSSNLTPVESELKQLSCCADTYERLNSPSPVSTDSDIRKFGNRMQFYDDLNIGRLDSFILFTEYKSKSDVDLLKVCNILESYIVRRMLCAKPDEDLYTDINNLFSMAIKAGDFSLEKFTNNLQKTLPEDSLKDALNSVWSKDANLILYILYRVELLKRETSCESYTYLNFKELEIPVRIALQVNQDYRTIQSIGNITPLRSNSPEWDLHAWDSYPINTKQSSLVGHSARGLVLSQEISEDDKWETDPAQAIADRTTNLLEHFDKVWKPNLADYV